MGTDSKENSSSSHHHVGGRPAFTSPRERPTCLRNGFSMYHGIARSSTKRPVTRTATATITACKSDIHTFTTFTCGQQRHQSLRHPREGKPRERARNRPYPIQGYTSALQSRESPHAKGKDTHGRGNETRSDMEASINIVAFGGRERHFGFGHQMIALSQPVLHQCVTRTSSNKAVEGPSMKRRDNHL